MDRIVSPSRSVTARSTRKPATVFISVETVIQFFGCIGAKYAASGPGSGPIENHRGSAQKDSRAGGQYQLYRERPGCLTPLQHHGEFRSIEGWHEAWIGLRGGAETSPQAWQWTKFKLDTTPPQLIVMSPVSTAVSQPLIQLKGFCPEPFSLDRL